MDENKKMKLLLASNGGFLIEKGYQILGIPKEQIKIGYVTTASKGTKNLEYLERHRQQMRDNGYNFQEIDIEGKTEKELRDFFKDKNIIHMEGGNTLYLLRAIKKTGFDKILKDLINNGMVYAGTSAGSSVMGPVIDFSSWVTEGTPKEDLIALNYVPFVFKAHYTDDKETEYKEKMKKVGYPVKFFRDGQGILVEDGKYTFVGDGEEVKI